jgi:alkyl hydroperoxide reductase subunit AhpC
MLDAQDLENIHEKGIVFTIRSVFIIDPAKKIRLTIMYPASCGRNTFEVLRIIDSLQTADNKAITTPIDYCASHCEDRGRQEEVWGGQRGQALLEVHEDVMSYFHGTLGS